jgi:hypothetical protein
MHFTAVQFFWTLTLIVDFSIAQNVTWCGIGSKPRPGYPCRQTCGRIIGRRPRRALTPRNSCNQTCLYPKCKQSCDNSIFDPEVPLAPYCPILQCNSNEWCSQQCAVGKCVCTSRTNSFAIPGCDQKCNPRVPSCIDLTCNSKTTCAQQCRGGSCNCNAGGVCKQLCNEVPCTELRCAAKFCTQESKNCNLMKCSSSSCVQQCDAGRCKKIDCNSEFCSQTCRKNSSVCAMQGKATKELKQVCEGNCSASCTGGAQCIQTCRSNATSCSLSSHTPGKSTQTCETACTAMMCTSSECTQICNKDCQNMTCSGTICRQHCQEGGCRMECTNDVNLCVQNCGSSDCTFTCNAKRCQACSKGNCTVVDNKGNEISFFHSVFIQTSIYNSTLLLLRTCTVYKRIR